MPFILLSKKRYVGQLYEDNPTDGYLKFMGLSLKRRDSCDYLKDVYGEILNILMNENDISAAVRFLENALTQLIEKKVPMDKLAITKALKSYYKIPQQIAHHVLSERIGNRDPGNKPKPGDRIKYVYVVNDKKKALLGEKIETPEFITSNKIAIDYTYYITNQLMKPLTQLFGLAVEQLWIMNNKPGSVRTYQKDMIKMEKEYGHDLETWMKKKEKYCSLKVKTILFDKFLEKIYNEKHGMQRIDHCFMRGSN
jgi:DNA polymerase elongation subunit (family B)